MSHLGPKWTHIDVNLFPTWLNLVFHALGRKPFQRHLCNCILKVPISMIRATRSKSTDRQTDRADLIIQMTKQTVENLQPPVALDESR